MGDWVRKEETGKGGGRLGEKGGDWERGWEIG